MFRRKKCLDKILALREREVKPLLAVKDAFPKMIIVAEGHYPTDIDGIKVTNIVDFLLHR